MIAEMESEFAKIFAACDKNGNGRICLAELPEVWKQWSAFETAKFGGTIEHTSAENTLEMWYEALNSLSEGDGITVADFKKSDEISMTLM